MSRDRDDDLMLWALALAMAAFAVLCWMCAGR
jgi:hypothetical protein